VVKSGKVTDVCVTKWEITLPPPLISPHFSFRIFRDINKYTDNSLEKQLFTPLFINNLLYLTTIPHQLIFICMEYKFLDKVIEQIISETEIDHDREIIIMKSFPTESYKMGFFTYTFQFPDQLIHRYFSIRCKEIYGLNDDEVEYVWDEYKRIIDNKIDG